MKTNVVQILHIYNTDVIQILHIIYYNPRLLLSYSSTLQLQ